MDQNSSTHVGEQMMLDMLSGKIAPSIFPNGPSSLPSRSGIGERWDTLITGMEERAADTFLGDKIIDIRERSSVLAEAGARPLTISYNDVGPQNQFDQLDTLMTDVPREFIHDYIKTRVPTIPFGTAHSPFSSVTLSGMSSGALFNALLSRTFRSPSDNQTSNSVSSVLEEVTVVPATAKVSGLGNPMFHYGQQFYLDLKTGTTSDNIFTVRDVTHNLGPGKFTTDLAFYPSGQQATVASVRSNMISTLNLLNGLEGREPREIPTPPGGPPEEFFGGLATQAAGLISDAAGTIIERRDNRRSERIRIVAEEREAQLAYEEAQAEGDRVRAKHAMELQHQAIANLAKEAEEARVAAALQAEEDAIHASRPLGGSPEDWYNWYLENDPDQLRFMLGNGDDDSSLPTLEEWIESSS